MREQIAQHRVIQRASRQPTNTQPPPDDDDDFDDDNYATSTPRSAIRYPLGRPYTYQQGNRRIVVHPAPPPRRFHWAVFWGLGMIFAIWRTDRRQPCHVVVVRLSTQQRLWHAAYLPG